MNAPVLSPELDKMPLPNVRDHAPSSFSTSTSRADWKEKLLPLPALLGSGLAASIAVFRPDATTSLALLGGVVGLFVLSIAISVPKAQTKT